MYQIAAIDADQAIKTTIWFIKFSTVAHNLYPSTPGVRLGESAQNLFVLSDDSSDEESFDISLEDYCDHICSVKLWHLLPVENTDESGERTLVRHNFNFQGFTAHAFLV